jgi:hypothetical protein
VKYVAVVEAFRISHVGDLCAEDGSRILALEGSTCVTATKEMLARVNIAAGDFWVIQGDGYIYLDPAEVFERGFSRLNTPLPDRTSPS